MLEVCSGKPVSSSPAHTKWTKLGFRGQSSGRGGYQRSPILAPDTDFPGGTAFPRRAALHAKLGILEAFGTVETRGLLERCV
jgi:hypothetical protein